jgi:hypothetical protein
MVISLHTTCTNVFTLNNTKRINTTLSDNRSSLHNHLTIISPTTKSIFSHLIKVWSHLRPFEMGSNSLLSFNFINLNEISIRILCQYLSIIIRLNQLSVITLMQQRFCQELSMGELQSILVIRMRIECKLVALVLAH